WCLDEPSAAIVDGCPRGLAARTCARMAGMVVVLIAWCLGVWWAWDDLFGHPRTVLVQGLSAAAVTVAVVTALRTAGQARPGQRWAAFVVPASTAWALARPLDRYLPVFPY